jgi:hypothetical protein
VDMPFGSMVRFMVKWAIASIPAAVILVTIVIVVGAVIGAAVGVVGSSLLGRSSSVASGVLADRGSPRTPRDPAGISGS